MRIEEVEDGPEDAVLTDEIEERVRHAVLVDGQRDAAREDERDADLGAPGRQRRLEHLRLLSLIGWTVGERGFGPPRREIFEGVGSNRPASRVLVTGDSGVENPGLGC